LRRAAQASSAAAMVTDVESAIGMAPESEASHGAFLHNRPHRRLGWMLPRPMIARCEKLPIFA
jgi:hypothetical protein